MAKRWRIKEKCEFPTFSLSSLNCSPVHLSGVEIKPTAGVCYLGLLLDKRLTWKKHIKLKKHVLNKLSELAKRIIGPKSELSTRKQIYAYNTAYIRHTEVNFEDKQNNPILN